MNAPRPTLRHVKIAAAGALAAGALVVPGGSVLNNAKAIYAEVGKDVRALPGNIAAVPVEVGKDARAIAKAVASGPHELVG